MVRVVNLKTSDFEAIRDGLPPLAPLLSDDLPLDAPLLQQYLCQYKFPVSQGADSILRVGQLSVGDYSICAYCWLPASSKGTTFLVHGYFDHVGLYNHLIKSLLDRGQTVVAFDLPGHGLSTGEPLAVDSFKSYQRVFRALLECCNDLPRPFYGVGQSTGGAVLLGTLQELFAQGADAPFKNTYLLAPLVRPWQWRRKLLKYWLLRWFVQRAPREFAINSHDKDFLHFLEHGEPMQQRHIPLSWVSAMVQWASDFADADPCPWPIAVLQGDMDTTVDGPYNLAQIARQFPSARLDTIAGVMHHMVNEREDIRARVFNWIDL
ncbi:alpha/beta hydrolase [bacterium SCSIO 12696]|nr:alpha/beta hydrolase [bacterium SCSIO 12696]